MTGLISGRELERFIAESFRRRGFTLTGFGATGPDGCADLGLTKGGERFLVQCRHWRKGQVDISIVLQMREVLVARALRSGFLVTGGAFTVQAREFAAIHGIELMDVRVLLASLNVADGAAAGPRLRAAGAGRPT